MAKPPRFSVILPLYDDRGQVFKALHAWLDQRQDASEFQIVLIDSGRKRLARKLRRLLATGDRIVHCCSRNEGTLYNAGAQAADGRWLLFTESHVIPEPHSVRALDGHLADNDFDAASLGCGHLVRSRFSELDARLFEKEQPEVRRLGLWRCVGMRGFLVRRSTFAALGGLEDRYFRFSETVFALNLVERNYRLIELEDVVLTHVDTDNVLELARAMYWGRIGTCRFWHDHPERAQLYFGGSCSEHCGAWQSPQGIRRALRGLLRLRRRGQSRMAYELWTHIRGSLPVACFGWKFHSAKVGLAALWQVILFYMELALYDPRTKEGVTQRLLGRYHRVRELFARMGAIRYSAEQPKILPVEQECWQWDVVSGELSQSTVGFYPNEVWTDQRGYKWSRPTAAVTLPLPAGEYQLTLDIAPTGGWAVRRPQLFVDGAPLAASSVEESEGNLYLAMRCRNTPILSWTCDAFKPAQHGLPDPRVLGVALVSVEARARGSKTTTADESAAAECRARSPAEPRTAVSSSASPELPIDLQEDPTVGLASTSAQSPSSRGKLKTASHAS